MIDIILFIGINPLLSKPTTNVTILSFFSPSLLLLLGFFSSHLLIYLSFEIIAFRVFILFFFFRLLLLYSFLLCFFYVGDCIDLIVEEERKIN